MEFIWVNEEIFKHVNGNFQSICSVSYVGFMLCKKLDMGRLLLLRIFETQTNKKQCLHFYLASPVENVLGLYADVGRQCSHLFSFLSVFHNIIKKKSPVN